MTTTAPAEALEAALVAYDEAVNAQLRNPPGFVIGPHYRAELARNPAMRAFAEAAWRAGVKAGRDEALAEMREEWCAWADGFQAPWADGCADRETAERWADQARRMLDLDGQHDVVRIKHRHVTPWAEPTPEEQS